MPSQQTICITEYAWNKPSPVCTDCFESIKGQRAYIPAILSLNSSVSAANYSRQQSRFLLSLLRSAPSPSETVFSGLQLHVPVSDYPKAGILKSVVCNFYFINLKERKTFILIELWKIICIQSTQIM